MATFPTYLNPLSKVLEERGISPEESIVLGIDHVDTRELQDLYGPRTIPIELTGVKIPYYDLDGTELIGRNKEPFVRHRFNNPPPDVPKYRQAKGSGLAAYIPRLGDRDWVVIAHDSSQELWITEGEFKAIALCKAGLNCIGLGGVDNWKGKDGAWARGLEHIQWSGKKVYLIYDADKESTQEKPYKQAVDAAASRFASALFESGAEVRGVYIARTEVFQLARAKDVDIKMGADDYLRAGGTVEDLRKTAERLAEDAIMARIVRQYGLFDGKNPHIVRFSDGVPFKRSEFTDTIEASAIRWAEKPRGGVSRIKVAQEWVDSNVKSIVKRYVFKPGEEGGYSAELQEYNIWRGFGVTGRVGEPESYNETVRAWKKLVKGLFGDQADFFEKWLAHLFQFPGEKTSIAIIVCSPLTGIGKSLLGEVIRGMVGREGSLAIELNRLKSNFNAVLVRKVFVQMDEAEGAFLGLESKLDDLITADTVVIEPKGFDAYSVDNFARLFLTSNSTRPIRMKAENRRWLVIAPELTVKDSKGEWNQWLGEVAAPRLKSEAGQAELRWYLDHVDLTGWVPTARVPVTAAMMDMVESAQTKSGNVLDGLWEEFQKDPDGVWALSPAMKKQDSKIWGDFKARVSINGGQTLSHVVNVKSDSTRFTIHDRDGRLPWKRDSTGDKVLDNAGMSGSRYVFTGEQVQSMAVKTLRAYTEQSMGANRNGTGGGGGWSGGGGGSGGSEKY